MMSKAPMPTIERPAPDDPDLRALMDLFYGDLRRMARRERFRVGAGATLCTTALVNEAWLKLQRTPAWQDQRHFLATAALAMRQVLVNDAQARFAAKRGEGKTPISLADAAVDAPDAADEQIVQVNDALEKLALLSPRLAQVVECRFFAGYSDVETAQALGLTDRTVRRDWIKARAWLYRELGEGAPDECD
ncbi:MAG: sigma-70 family RNA polymerase sigma factor [Dokdonella sp.]|nr:sigma-70 family RNA polymerase sigma factor [Dokdonella sp.]